MTKVVWADVETRPRANLPGSVHQRRLNLSQGREEDFSLLLTHFAIERLLVRLSGSAEAGHFIVKGALASFNEQHSATQDQPLSHYAR